METVRHHVAASGNSTLRGFFGSDNVDYDPSSLSLRENVKKAKCQHVYQLADGATDDDDEADIRDTMKGSENSYEMTRMFFAMDGWGGLDDELEEGYLDEIATTTAQVLDQREYPPYQLIRRHLPLLDYNASPNLGDAFDKILTWPPQFQPAEFDSILLVRDQMLHRIASATLRNRVNMLNAARIEVPVIARYGGVTHRQDELVLLMHQIRYTVRICVGLQLLRYDDLYNVVADMADPGIVDIRQRQAAHDAVDFLHLEFAAAEGAVNLAGDNAAKQTVGRFMTARQAALDAWVPNVPPGTILTALAAVIAPLAASFNDLKNAIINLPDIAGAITLSSFLGDDSDDNARAFVSAAQSQNWLDRVPARVKTMAIRACLDGWTVDDDEIAILACLKAARAYDQAELYQLAAAATWDDLYSSIDGDEYDELESTLDKPDLNPTIW